MFFNSPRLKELVQSKNKVIKAELGLVTRSVYLSINKEEKFCVSLEYIQKLKGVDNNYMSSLEKLIKTGLYLDIDFIDELTSNDRHYYYVNAIPYIKDDGISKLMEEYKVDNVDDLIEKIRLTIVDQS